MVVDKFTPLNYFEIWEPRWYDRKVMLAAHKVGTHNKIKFTKAKSLGEEPYYVSGATVKQHPKETNGKIQCYAVPLADLEPLEVNNRDVREVI
jgi:hypothetical protein